MAPGFHVKEIMGRRWAHSPWLIIVWFRSLVLAAICELLWSVLLLAELGAVWHGIAMSLGGQTIQCSSLSVWKKEMGRRGRRDMLLTLTLSIIVVLHALLVARSPASCVKKGMGERESLTYSMWTVTMTCVITVFSIPHRNGVRWSAGDQIHNDDKRRMSVIVHHLVAMSLSATWHLDAVLEGSVVGAGELLTSACPVFQLGGLGRTWEGSYLP